MAEKKRAAKPAAKKPKPDRRKAPARKRPAAARKPATKAPPRKQTRRPARPLRSTPEAAAAARAVFLAAFAECCNVRDAARTAGVHRSRHYAWLQEDAAYAAAFAEAKQEAIDALVGEVRRRGVEGWLEPVFYQGEQVATIRKFDSTLLIFLLKALDPERFRENVRVEGSVNVEQLAERLAAGRARVAASDTATVQ